MIAAMEGPQAQFILSDKRFPAFLGGVGSGKTAGLMIKVMFDFQRYAPNQPGMLAAYTVPVSANAHMFFLPKWRELYRDFEGDGPDGLWTWHDKLSVIRFVKWDAQLFLRSAGEPDALRGPEFARMYMDEIASRAIGSQEELFRIGQGRIRQKGFGPQQIAVASTPRTVFKWIVQRWQDKINPLTGTSLPNPDDYPIFNATTSDNFHLDEDYKQSLIAEWGGTRWGEQELEGKFISVEGLVFDMLDADVHRRYPPDDTIRTIYGFDIGGVSPTAIIEWKLDRDGRRYATAEYYKRNADEYEWVQWLADRNAMSVYCDPSISDGELDYWRKRYGIRFIRSRVKAGPDRTNKWRQGLTYNSLRPPTIYISPDCVNLWNELTELAYATRRRSDDPIEKWADGCADHAFDAGAYGLDAFERPFGRPPPPNVRRAVGVI